MSVPTHLSPEYVAALEAQLDFDSSTDGLAAVEAALTSCDDADARVGLTARLVSGRAARRFRSEQLALMPPAVRRSHPLYWPRDHLADLRVDLARSLAYAAAETDAWGCPTPGGAGRVLECADAVVEADRAMGEHFRPEQHPGPLQHERELRAPWTAQGKTLPVGPSDVGVLVSLGVDARWQDDVLVALGGDVDAAERWGYRLAVASVEGGGAASAGGGSRLVIVGAPAIVRWFKAQAAAT